MLGFKRVIVILLLFHLKTYLCKCKSYKLQWLISKEVYIVQDPSAFNAKRRKKTRIFFSN